MDLIRFTTFSCCYTTVTPAWCSYRPDQSQSAVMPSIVPICISDCAVCIPYQCTCQRTMLDKVVRNYMLISFCIYPLPCTHTHCHTHTHCPACSNVLFVFHTIHYDRPSAFFCLCHNSFSINWLGLLVHITTMYVDLFQSRVLLTTTPDNSWLDKSHRILSDSDYGHMNTESTLGVALAYSRPCTMRYTCSSRMQWTARKLVTGELVSVAKVMS